MTRLDDGPDDDEAGTLIRWSWPAHRAPVAVRHPNTVARDRSEAERVPFGGALALGTRDNEVAEATRATLDEPATTRRAPTWSALGVRGETPPPRAAAAEPFEDVATTRHLPARRTPTMAEASVAPAAVEPATVRARPSSTVAPPPPPAAAFSARSPRPSPVPPALPARLRSLPRSSSRAPRLPATASAPSTAPTLIGAPRSPSPPLRPVARRVRRLLALMAAMSLGAVAAEALIPPQRAPAPAASTSCTPSTHGAACRAPAAAR